MRVQQFVSDQTIRAIESRRLLMSHTKKMAILNVLEAWAEKKPYIPPL